MRARAEAVEATRDRIARAAMARFLAQLYDVVTIAAVAADAGVSTLAGDRERGRPHDAATAVAALMEQIEATGDGNVRLALPPELSVARALVDRGHRVSLLSDPTAEAEALAAGADFRPWVQAPHLRSLAAGVPALVLPMGRDQLDNAGRDEAADELEGAARRVAAAARD